jgi:hypothetical protein
VSVFAPFVQEGPYATSDLSETTSTECADSEFNRGVRLGCAGAGEASVVKLSVPDTEDKGVFRAAG